MARDGFGSGKSNNNSPINSVHDGLKNRSPKWPDKSINPSMTKGLAGGSMSRDATRSNVAPTPKTLGPRTA